MWLKKEYLKELKIFKDKMTNAKNKDEVADAITGVMDLNQQLNRETQISLERLEEFSKVLKYGNKIIDEKFYQRICSYCHKYTENKGHSSGTTKTHICDECYQTIIVPKQKEIQRKRLEGYERYRKNIETSS